VYINIITKIKRIFLFILTKNVIQCGFYQNPHNNERYERGGLSGREDYPAASDQYLNLFHFYRYGLF